MKPTIEEMTFEKENFFIGNSMYSCRNCGKLLDRVFLDENQWLYCPSCQWNRDKILSDLDGMGIRAR